MTANKVRVTDHGAKRARELLKQPRKQLLLGVLDTEANKKHPSGPTIGEIAIWMEFGTPTIKPRSWLFDWLDENIDIIAQQLGADTKRVIFDKADERTALERRGSVYRQQVEDRIRYENVLHGNEPSTIMKKGFDLPLIDTETFIEAIRWKVK
jgi:hypothetical protein